MDAFARLGLSVVVAFLLGGCPPGASNNPGRSFLGACRDGDVKVCVGQCVTPVGLGEFCYTDPCNVLAIGANLTVCGGNLRCDPTPVPGDVVGGRQLPPGTGICRAVSNNPMIPVACNPTAVLGSAASPCPHNPGWFCASIANPACVARPANLPAGSLGVCTLPLGEGQSTCDGDWTDVLNQTLGRTPICHPCSPGLRCHQGTCRRRCDAGVGGMGACQPTSGEFGQPYEYRCETVPTMQAAAAGHCSNAMQICLRVARHNFACPPPSFETRSTTIASVPFVPFGPIRPGYVYRGLQSAHDYNELYTVQENQCTQLVPVLASPSNPFNGNRQEPCLDP